MILLGFYVVFAFNNVIDSIFYGLGKTGYMLCQSLIVNIVLYGTAFILYQTGVYQPTLESIAIMFGCGILMDKAVTITLYIYMLKKIKKESLEIDI